VSDLTRTTREEVEAQEAFEAQEGIKQTIRRMRYQWAVLAGQLYDFHKRRLWEKLGYETVGDWMASPDIDLEYRQTYILIQVYREWVHKQGFSVEEVGRLNLSRLQVVTPAVQNRRISAKEAFADVESLSRTDLRERYQGLATIEQRLEATEEATYFTCPSCGSRVKRRE
jgi:hypothetical protein